MRAGRVLIGTVLFLGAGVWVIFAYCKGTAGFNLSTNITECRVTLDLATVGVPMLVGLGLTGIGLLLFLIAFIEAIVMQFRGPREAVRDQVTPRRDMPFEG